MFHGAFVAGLGVLAWPMTADVIEDSQRQGYIIKGSILTAVGFSTAVTDAEKIAAVEDLAWVFVLLGILLPSIALIIFSKYAITRQIHEQNLVELGYDD